MNDLTNTLLDIARTAVEHDATLLNKMPCSITDGPRHPDEDADYDNYLEQQRQNWWQQMDEDEQYIQDHDFAEYQEEDR